MREMQMQKEADMLPRVQERKINPLGKPNKDFLDRTINSVMRHNKRQYDRNHRNCQRKLRDMDAATRERRKRRYSNHKSDSSTESSDSSKQKKHQKEKKNKKLTKKKKKKHKKQSSSSSSPSSSSSSPSTLSSATSSESIDSNEELGKKKKTKKHKRKHDRKEKEENANEDYYHQEVDPSDPHLALYMDHNMVMAAAMAYNQMNQLLQSTNRQQRDPETELLIEELKEEGDSDKEKMDIPSDLSLTYHTSESEDLNISLNSSSAEEDENGVLTFNLSSDEEKNRSGNKTKRPTKSHEKKQSPSYVIENESDVESVHSHISLKSDISEKGHTTSNNCILSISSSSSSDSDCQEVEVTPNVCRGEQKEVMEKESSLVCSLEDGNLESNKLPEESCPAANVVAEEQNVPGNLAENSRSVNDKQEEEKEELPTSHVSTEKEVTPEVPTENVEDQKMESSEKEDNPKASKKDIEDNKEVNIEGNFEGVNEGHKVLPIHHESSVMEDNPEVSKENVEDSVAVVAEKETSDNEHRSSSDKDMITDIPKETENTSTNITDNNSEVMPKVIECIEENSNDIRKEEVLNQLKIVGSLTEVPEVRSHSKDTEVQSLENEISTDNILTQSNSPMKTEESTSKSLDDDSHNQNSEPAKENVVDLTSD
ncbi:myb-like protein X [Musca vetustissima]|uniref:myb-like protein X n=1 Tax=Musca vetustissima TaxID=27455 RepID=UPI002AB7C5BF|nr:myb-like protein X [Musca vetustissima]